MYSWVTVAGNSVHLKKPPRVVEILRVSRISRISREIGLLGARVVFIGKILVFPATRSRIRAVFGVSAKLAARRNDHNPALIVRANIVYLNPNGKDVSYLYIWVPIAGNSEHLQNRLGVVEILRISRIPRKVGIRRALHILSRLDFGFYVTHSRMREVFGVSA